MLSKKHFSILFYAILVIGFIIYLLNARVGGIILYVFFPLLILLLYSVFIKAFKEEEVYFANTPFQYILVIFSTLASIFLFLNFAFQMMHWKGSIIITLILFSIIIINGILVIIDLFLNIKRKNKTYGFQYFLLLLPLILFIGNMISNIDSRKSDERTKYLIQLYEFKRGRMQKLFVENESLVNNIKSSLTGTNDKIDQIHAETKELHKYLQDVREILISKTGGVNPETGSYVGAKEMEMIHIEMVGSQGRQGKAYELQEQLNDYCNLINKSEITLRPFIAIDAKDTSLYKNDPDHNHKDFAQLHFQNATLIEALNALTFLQTEVLLAEQDVLVNYLFNELKKEKGQP